MYQVNKLKFVNTKIFGTQKDREQVIEHQKIRNIKFFSELGSCKADKPLQGMELLEKKSKKRSKHTGNLFRKNL